MSARECTCPMSVRERGEHSVACPAALEEAGQQAESHGDADKAAEREHDERREWR